MIDIPAYFELVRQNAANRWEQLENNPELAAPWHQLFKQVQVPNHVLSELLQNADDAKAASASVSIENGEFVFRHDGEDFTEEHFTSLCRFGFSNKRSLHTIGFRGIGFKSIFSLGDQVYLQTPTLSVVFHRRQFTVPVWQAPDQAIGHTEVRVRIRDDYLKQQLAKNVKEWLRSPVSLLFFRELRCLHIGNQEIRWEKQHPGPVQGSEWMALSSNPETACLLIRSQEEMFPPDALEEIKQERMITAEESANYPPCRIEIVLGQEGKFFVILPTGVKTSLPFACNAPFIQDPARLKIKEPDNSPTNRWLLARIGELAAKTLVSWVERKEADPDERSRAYSLLSVSETESSTLEGTCAGIVEQAALNVLGKEQCIMTESGDLAAWGDAVAIPEILLDIWNTETILQYFFEGAISILSSHISSANRASLISSNAVSRLSDEKILTILESKKLPRPEDWRRLLLLWVYVAPFIKKYKGGYGHYLNVNIVPVQGKDTLYSAKNLVIPGENMLLHSEEDWDFLSQYLLIMNKSWPVYLSEQRNIAQENDNLPLNEEIDTAYALLDKLDLSKPGDGSSIFQQVINKISSNKALDKTIFIKMAQIAATLDVNVHPSTFRYMNRNGSWHLRVERSFLADLDGDLESFVPASWYNKHVLHEDYNNLVSCTQEEWRNWVSSERSKLYLFVPIYQKDKYISKTELVDVLHARGFAGEISYAYRSSTFVLQDWDFPEDIWEFWRKEASTDETYWCGVLAKILSLPPRFWMHAAAATIIERAGNGRDEDTKPARPAPAWITRFRALPCLRDTHGGIRQPAELLRRTPDTEVLLDVDPFVQADIDNETLRPLLVLLGVRDTPTSPTRLLDQLRALAATANPPAYEVEKWYHRLDRMLNRYSTQEAQEIKAAFSKEKIILVHGGGWGNAAEVFLTADEEEAPDAVIIHPPVKDLALWRSVGVAESPVKELTVEWLAGIKSGRKFTASEQRRVRPLLARSPEYIWHKCGHWLNLENEWASTNALTYYVNQQTRVLWESLFTPIKRKTADLRDLPADLCSRPPFSSLRCVAQCLEERPDEEINNDSPPQEKPWLTALGMGLRRIVPDNEEEAQRIHELAARLAGTRWQLASGLRMTPYIDGSPAGAPRLIEALWRGDVLYVSRDSSAGMLKPATDILGREFNCREILEAIKSCYERDPDFIREYLEENFKLMPEE